MMIPPKDAQKIDKDLLEFYDFEDRTVITVGAGEGRFTEYGRNSTHVFTIDCNEDALVRFKETLDKAKLDYKFTLIRSDFYDCKKKGDVVLFEFCLHEMTDTKAAIMHALTMAPNVLITDWWPDSEWAYIADENEKVLNSWKSINKLNLKKVKRVDSQKFFRDYDELYQKVKSRGEKAVQRIEKYKDMTDFSIPVSYGIALY
jgi:hypothetical protein